MVNTTENIIWTAKPSQALFWVKYMFYLVFAFGWLFLPSSITNYELYKGIYFHHISAGISILIAFLAFTSFLKLITTKYEITNERIFIYSGILNRLREEIEIYRVKDYQVYSPVHIRIFGLSNLFISTSDRTTPTFTLYALQDCYKVADMLREKVELQRKQKGVREFD